MSRIGRTIMVARKSLDRSKPVRERGVSVNSLLALGALMGVQPDETDFPPRGAEAERMTLRLPKEDWQQIDSVKNKAGISRSQAASGVLAAIARQIASGKRASA